MATTTDTTVLRKAARSVPATDTDSIASEIDVPWAIALLSEGRAPVRKRRAHVTVVDGGPDATDPAGNEATLEVSIDRSASDHKSQNTKTCGVVNRRT